MSEEKVYTKTEHEILVSVARVETLQCISDENFRDHIKDNEDHFNKLYAGEKRILSEVSKIPTKMTECSERIKTETLQVVRKQFVSATDQETNKSDVKEGNAEMKGSLKTTYIVMGLFQSVLLIFLAAWLRSNGV